MLELIDICKSFDGKIVLDKINFSVSKGEIVSMLGASGSGKTTILNIILGLINMDSGKLFFAGKDITKVPMKDRGFNIVFQDYALFPNLNARENVLYGIKNKKDSMNSQELEDLIDFLELHPHLEKKISQLSGGQKQRVALARTLAVKPHILLLDEPLSALDGVIKETIKDKLKLITKRYGLTTIIVTHDPEEALTLSDKVLIVHKGKVSQYGTPQEVMNRPENDYVKDFILRQLMIKRDNIYNLFNECHA